MTQQFVSFYMVLADNSGYMQVRHSSLEMARNEARRLAAKNPGLKFHVLASLGHMVKDDPIAWQQHEPDDDQIPF